MWSFLVPVTVGIHVNLLFAFGFMSFILPVTSSVKKDDEVSGGKRTVNGSPRRRVNNNISTSSVNNGGSTTNPVTLAGLILCAFLESFGLYYMLKLAGATSIRSGLGLGWFLWQFFVLPAAVLQSFYLEESGKEKELNIAGGDEWERVKRVVVKMAFQLGRLMLEGAVVAFTSRFIK